MDCRAERESEELTKAQHIVEDLFHFYMQSPQVLPGAFKPDSETTEGWAQQACDYVAGMTDRFALAQYTKHFLPAQV